MTHSFPTRRSSDLVDREIAGRPAVEQVVEAMAALRHRDDEARLGGPVADPRLHLETLDDRRERRLHRSEAHTSELQSLMRISYAVFCLKKKKKQQQHDVTQKHTKQKKIITP